MATPNHKVDIFELLAAIDKGDTAFYDRLTDDEKKSIPMSVVMRWLSTVSDKSGMAEYYLLMVNELVNVGFWDLYEHPKLQFLLMTCVSPGKPYKHQWVPLTKAQNASKAMTIVHRANPGIRPAEEAIFLDAKYHHEIIEMALNYGYDDKFIRSLKKELSNYK